MNSNSISESGMENKIREINPTYEPEIQIRKNRDLTPGKFGKNPGSFDVWKLRGKIRDFQNEN